MALGISYRYSELGGVRQSKEPLDHRTSQNTQGQGMGKATGTPPFPAQDVHLAGRPGSFTAPVLSQSQHPWGLDTPVLQPQHKGMEGEATMSLSGRHNLLGQVSSSQANQEVLKAPAARCPSTAEHNTGLKSHQTLTLKAPERWVSKGGAERQASAHLIRPSQS